VKIAHLTTVDLSLRYLLLAQLKALREEGHDVVGMSAPGPWVAELEHDGIRHIALQSSTRVANVSSDLRSMVELWRVLRRSRPDVLHTHNPKPGFYGRIVGRIAGVPIVVNTVHGVYATTDDPWPKRLGIYALEAIAARFSDAELIQNPEDFDFMRRTRITRRAQLLGNGIDLGRFDPARFTREDREAVRSSFGATSGQVVIGTVGRLVAEKGYPELFDAIRRLDADRYLLVVVGAEDPEKPDALPDETVARARAAGVRFLGHRDDVDALYAAMDIFVLASHREGYPRAAMEATAMRLPVVATDIRGCRQVVEHGHNGLLVPPRDAGAIAGAIRRLGDGPVLRSDMGDAGRSLARARFDERVVARAVAETYRAVAARKGIPTWRVDVLQVISSNDRRGPETHAVDLAAALEARGYRVRTVALAPGRHCAGLDVPTLGGHALALGTLRRLRRESSAADVVVAHGSSTLPACACALAGRGVSLVYRSIGDPERWASTTARRARVRAYLRRANLVVALTAKAASAIRSMYGLPSDRVAVIPIGVRPERHQPADSTSRLAARARFGIPDGADVAAVIGALSPEKDVALAIDAAAAVRSLHLVVAGDGPERPALERQAAQVAPGRVRFAGPMRDPSPAFAAADFVLSTSRTEGLPAVLIEAGLRELPVVATDVGYVREIVVDGETGHLVNSGMRSELVSAIKRVLRDRTPMGTTARQRCQGRFDLERVADQWDVVLSNLRRRVPTGACQGQSDPPTLSAAGAAHAAPAPRAGSQEQ
jgi:glycosyltransferase involved in cell wall biosynthesis